MGLALPSTLDGPGDKPCGARASSWFPHFSYIVLTFQQLKVGYSAE